MTGFTFASHWFVKSIKFVISIHDSWLPENGSELALIIASLNALVFVHRQSFSRERSTQTVLINQTCHTVLSVTFLVGKLLPSTMR